MLLAMLIGSDLQVGMETANCTVRTFGSLPDGRAVSLYTIRNETLTASFTDFGARLVSLQVPDRWGALADVVLGFDSVEPYFADRKTYMGATVGRLANRLAGGHFSLDGRSIAVTPNDGKNALHGGPNGFDRRLWATQEIINGVEMTLISPDGDQGFPGTLTITVRYTLLDNALHFTFAAKSDRVTVANIVNHAYFNLAGGSGTILHHELMIPADRFTPINAELIPTGELAGVGGTPLDFRIPTPIGARIDEPDEHLLRAGGYDHNWVLGEPGARKLAARLRDPGSGRVMTVETTQPGVQFYSGNFLDGSLVGREGKSYGKHAGLCLETQHYPDSPNQPSFPTTELKPGDTMQNLTTYTFSTDAE